MNEAAAGVAAESDPEPDAKKSGRKPRSGAAARILGAAGAAYMATVFYTTRWRWVGREHLDAMFAAPGFIAAVWHARILPIAMLRPKGRRAVALISNNRDGDALTRALAHTGAEAVRGSSRDPRKPDKEKGGAAAMGKLIDALDGGAIIVMTPDGPRGPRMRAKAGAAALSASVGAPVLPVAYSIRRARILKSWDRFMAPWPFSRGVFVFGAPIAPAPAGDEAAIEAKRLEIEAAVNEATRAADRLLGRETPEPGPAMSPSAARKDAALESGRRAVEGSS